MPADQTRIRRFLETASFRPMLFEMGWNRLRIDDFPLVVTGRQYVVAGLAERSGFQALEVRAADGHIPHTQERWGISNRLQGFAREHLLIFVNERRSECLFQSPPGASIRHGVASHRTFLNAIGSRVVDLVAGLDLRSLGESPGITDVTLRVGSAFRDDRFDYYSDHGHLLAHAETEAGIVSRRVRKSPWNYDDNIAARDLDEEDYRRLGAVIGALSAQVLRPPLRLDTVYAPVNQDRGQFRNGFLRADLRGDPSEASPHCAATAALLREHMAEALDSLTSRERRVLILRFGLEDDWSRTLEEVGREFGVTRERIRQIEAKALRKLRHPSRSNKLKDYLDSDLEDLHAGRGNWLGRLWGERLSRAEGIAVGEPATVNVVGEEDETRASPTPAVTSTVDSGRLRSERRRRSVWAKRFRVSVWDVKRTEKQVRAEIAEERRARKAEASRRYALPIDAWLRGRWGSIRLDGVPRETFFLYATHSVRGHQAARHAIKTSPRRQRRAVEAELIEVFGDQQHWDGQVIHRDPSLDFPGPGPTQSPVPTDEDDFLIDDLPAAPSVPAHQQPLDLPGSLPLFDQPGHSPSPSGTDPSAQLLFRGLEPEPPSGGGVPSRKESLQLAVESFRRDGFAVADNRHKGGALWVYDPTMSLANRIEGLRSIGIRFVYAEHKSAGKWGWWIK